MHQKSSKEDKDIVQRGEMLRSLVESDGWKIAKEMLDAKIDVVKYVSTLDLSESIENIGKEAYARAKAVELIQSWFNLIQGEIDSYYEHLADPKEEEQPDWLRDESA